MTVPWRGACKYLHEDKYGALLEPGLPHRWSRMEKLTPVYKNLNSAVLPAFYSYAFITKATNQQPTKGWPQS